MDESVNENQLITRVMFLKEISSDGDVSTVSTAL